MKIPISNFESEKNSWVYSEGHDRKLPKPLPCIFHIWLCNHFLLLSGSRYLPCLPPRYRLIFQGLVWGWKRWNTLFPIKQRFGPFKWSIVFSWYHLDCIYFISIPFIRPSPPAFHLPNKLITKKKLGGSDPHSYGMAISKGCPLMRRLWVHDMWLSSSSPKYIDTDVSEVLEGKRHVLNWTDAPSKTPNFKTLVACIHSTCFLLLVVGGCFLQPPTTNQQTNKLKSNPHHVSSTG